MVKIPENVRNRLKKPLGKLYKDFKELMELSRSHRIISVGDVCTLGLLAMGIRPHLAVFDHKFMRSKLDPEKIKILELYFNNPKSYKNPAGTLSDEIRKDAKKLLEDGGAIIIDGEEDLTALAFIEHAGKKDIVVYGQPEQGIVVVRPDSKLKKKIEEWLSAALSL